MINVFSLSWVPEEVQLFLFNIIINNLQEFADYLVRANQVEK